MKTGEEEEEVLYSHKAKVYRYTEGEWKERGLGDIKILKHKGSGKVNRSTYLYMYLFLHFRSLSLSLSIFLILSIKTYIPIR